MVSKQSEFKHAIVVGGSMAGILAARVLAEHFERVTIIERDERSSDVEPRRGVPQGRHAHALLLAGQRTIFDLFPDARHALMQAGASLVNLGREMRWHHFGVWKRRFTADSGLRRNDAPAAWRELEMLAASRPLIEWTLGTQLRRLANVNAIDGWSVDEFVHDGERIVGVKARPRGGNRAQQFMPADLVVDASGRGSQTPARLRDLGYASPRESMVKVDVGYASRICRAAEGARDWRALYVIAQPPAKRGALILPIEPDEHGARWMVTQVGLHGDHPPDDDAGFLAFAKSLPVPDIYDAIQRAEPLTPIVRHGYPVAVRRHYDALHLFPEGLLVLGDAFCSFNPVYGQGMSAAAMYAETLSSCIEDRIAAGRSLAGLWKSFFPQAAAIADRPWGLATGEDFRFSETTGPRPAMLGFLHWYTRKVQLACAHDARVTERFYEVMNLLRKPTSLFEPGIMWRVLTAGTKRASSDQLSPIPYPLSPSKLDRG